MIRYTCNKEIQSFERRYICSITHRLRREIQRKKARGFKEELDLLDRLKAMYKEFDGSISFEDFVVATIGRKLDL